MQLCPHSQDLTENNFRPVNMSDSEIGPEEGLGTKVLFPRRLRQRRETLGLTQEQVGARVGVTYSSVARWENGSREPSFTALISLASYLHVSVPWLIGLDVPAPRTPQFDLGKLRRLVKSAEEIYAALLSLLPDDEVEGRPEVSGAGIVAGGHRNEKPQQPADPSPPRPFSKRRGRP